MRDSSSEAAQLEASWDRNAGAWISALRKGTIESRRLVTDRAIVDAVLARQPRRVLDLGCGEGWLARVLSQQGIDCTGVDGSAELIETARASGQGRFWLRSYTELAADPASIGNDFDVIVANFALLHETLVPLLTGLAGVLAADGVLIVQTVHPDSVADAGLAGWRREDFSAFEGEWQSMPWYYRPLEAWLAVMKQSGYGVTAVTAPRHPDTGNPLSLLLTAEPGRQDSTPGP